MDPDRVRIELGRHDFLDRNQLELNRYELIKLLGLGVDLDPRSFYVDPAQFDLDPGSF